jgi:hypothetical protein
VRAFATGGIKSNKTLRGVVLGALGLLALHGVASVVHFAVKFRFSAVAVEQFFFGAPELPEPVSAAFVFENLHTGLFVFGFLFLTLAALVMQTPYRLRVRLGLIASLFAFGLLDSLSGLVLLAVGRDAAALKVAAFCLYQASFFAVISGVAWSLIAPERDDADGSPTNPYRLAVVAFAIVNIGFAAANAALLFSKVGASPAAVARYFVGDPSGFSRPQSVESMLEFSAVHFLTVGLYLLALVHLMFIRLGRDLSLLEPESAVLRRRRIARVVAVALFATAVLNLLSGYLVRFVSADVAVVKLIASLGFSASLIAASVVLLHSARANRPLARNALTGWTPG